MTPLPRSESRPDPDVSEKCTGKIEGKTRIFPWKIAALLSGGVILFALLSSPASAQEPIVTPYPGPIATVTAAAEQAQSAEADRAAAQQTIQQGQQQYAQAQAKIQAAQQAANDARAALQAQQYQAALDAVGRAEASVNDALALINSVKAGNDETSNTVNAQASRIISLTLENQQIRSDNAQLRESNNALVVSNRNAVTQAEASAKSGNVLSIVPVFLMFLFLIGMIVLALGIRQWRNGNNAATVTVERNDEPDEIIESEVISDD